MIAVVEKNKLFGGAGSPRVVFQGVSGRDEAIVGGMQDEAGGVEGGEFGLVIKEGGDGGVEGVVGGIDLVGSEAEEEAFFKVGDPAFEDQSGDRREAKGGFDGIQRAERTAHDHEARERASESVDDRFGVVEHGGE